MVKALWLLVAVSSLTFCPRAAAFGTMVALRPGRIVAIDCKKPAQLPPGGGDDFVAIACGKDLFLALLRLRGMESRAPSGLAEGFYGRKLAV